MEDIAEFVALVGRFMFKSDKAVHWHFAASILSFRVVSIFYPQ